MRTIGKVLTACVFAALVAVAGARAASSVPMEGEFAKVSWTTWVGTKGYSGYLFVTRQPDGTTYLYYVIQSGNEPPATGYGLIPNRSLRPTRTGGLELSLDLSRLRGMTISGTNRPGLINVVWAPMRMKRVYSGASGGEMGSVTELIQGTWTGGAAVATGSVLAWKIATEQSAEIGYAFGASNQIGGLD